MVLCCIIKPSKLKKIREIFICLCVSTSNHSISSLEIDSMDTQDTVIMTSNFHLSSDNGICSTKAQKSYPKPAQSCPANLLNSLDFFILGEE